MIQLFASFALFAFFLVTPLVNATTQNTGEVTHANAPASAQTTASQPGMVSQYNGNSFNQTPFWQHNTRQYYPRDYFPEPFSYPTDPVQVIKDTLEKITTFTTRAENVSPSDLRRFIETEIIPHFDFNNMTHWIIGPYARYMKKKKKVAFQKQLRETFLSSLARHLGSFDAENTQIRFIPAQYRGPMEAFVRTIIYRRGTSPMRLNFRMRRAGDSWKIIDVRANGASAVLYYRQHFMSQLHRYRDNY